MTDQDGMTKGSKNKLQHSKMQDKFNLKLVNSEWGS